jgi:uncharacterized protein YkwD
MFSVAAPVFADPVATQIINDIPKDKRRKPVRYSTQLEGVAKAHADEMASKGYFSHTGANGSTVGSRTTAQGYKGVLLLKTLRKANAVLNR